MHTRRNICCNVTLCKSSAACLPREETRLAIRNHRYVGRARCGRDRVDSGDCGDAGGFECYIAADDEDDNGNIGKGKAGASLVATDEYSEEDDTELISLSASNNTLSIRFVKYVGSSAPSSRWDISLEYEVKEFDKSEERKKPIARKSRTLGFRI